MEARANNNSTIVHALENMVSLSMGNCKKYYTYILLCADGTLYTGYTDNLEKRLRTHNEGRGAKYTRGRLPVTLKYACSHATRGEAQSHEAKIKQLSRQEKLLLLEGMDPLPENLMP